MDGLEPSLLEKWWDELPNFRRLRDEGAFTRMDSVYPPDSVPAWATIYTGATPDYHGILDSVDYLDTKQKAFKCDTGGLTGNTFWDAAGDQGKRVCVINPFMAYPVWPVNGIMVNGPVFVTGDIQAHPDSILTDCEVPELGGIVDQPTKKTLGAFAERTMKLTEDHLRFSKELFARERWDLYFINFLTLDRVQHSFWRHCDPTDPTYPGKNPHSEVIKDFYRLHDRIIGEYLDLIDEDTVLMVFGDHGHGMRCTKAFLVNEFLRQQGLLKSSASRSRLDPKRLLERMKMLVLRTLDRYDMQDYVFKIARLIPGAKSLKKSTFVIDQAGSSAGVARFSGMNPYGGVDLPRSGFDSDEKHEEAVERLIADLLKVRDPKTGKQIVTWAMRREEMYRGPYASIYPEVIFQLDFEYGVSRSLFGPIVDVNPTHRKVSGGHMPEAALLMNRPLPEYLGGSIVTIAPGVLRLLGLEPPEHMERRCEA